MKDEEQRIVRLLQLQEKKAIAWLYDRYSTALYGVALKIVRSGPVAQDVVQEAYVKAWRNGPTYDSKRGSLFTWLLNIVRNLAIDKTRSISYRMHENVQPLDYSLHKEEMVHLVPESSEITTNDHLRRHVGQLSDKYREAIELSFFRGFTHEEAAEHLQLPLGTFKSRVRGALHELRKTMQEHQVTIFLAIILHPL